MTITNSGLPALGLAVLLLLLLAACGGGTATAPPTESAGEDHGAHETGAPAETGAGGGESMEVALADFAFAPTELTVPAGTTVTFTNEDSALHSVSEGSDGQVADDAAFDEDVEGGASVEITFDESGTVQVTCKYHPSMNMTVTVEG
ncbi:MAG TPA: plastocyanin/azurin family copper-binding protein [Candidatus Limnocylindria bacterium]|nr:plastocyanin/azurin family copper-binding protein [Candidatus Limnocylindria bacterium]